MPELRIDYRDIDPIQLETYRAIVKVAKDKEIPFIIVGASARDLVMHHGYKKARKQNPEEADARAEAIIKNTYRTLMSRGLKGCLIYCTDAETQEYFWEQIALAVTEDEPEPATESAAANQAEADETTTEPEEGVRFLSAEEVSDDDNAVPFIDLPVAAGEFAEGFAEIQTPPAGPNLARATGHVPRQVGTLCGSGGRRIHEPADTQRLAVPVRGQPWRQPQRPGDAGLPSRHTGSGPWWWTHREGVPQRESAEP